ncbi:MAG: diacylglycerol/polyprenol kinase family protein [Candidatus Bathycorpusculaceae bacterium]
MFDYELLLNLALMFLCYAYVLIIIFVSGKIDKILKISRKASRKFLHAMIGNLPFIIPFFTFNTFPLNFPFFVAAPFIVLTFLASPYTPFKNFTGRFRELADITEEGHHLGLVFYAVAYTFLALFFASKPYVIAAGVLPMAYGDAAASAVGERSGKRKYKLFAGKSLEGSAAMFLVTFTSLVASAAYFSMFYPLSIFGNIFVFLFVAFVAAVAEGFSPLGFDNLTVPFFSVLVLLYFGGGF